MIEITPFRGYRPRGDCLEASIAPPYDVISRKEAKQFAANKPTNFLHLSKPEIDLEDSIADDDPRIYERGKDKLEEFITDKVLLQDVLPGFYVYQISTPKNKQIGLLTLLAVSQYHNGLIKSHEQTRIKKVQERLRHMQMQMAHLSPVLLMHEPNHHLKSLLRQITQASPTSMVAYADATHTIWHVTDSILIDKLQHGYRSVSRLYIADGHHRSEAAASAEISSLHGGNYSLAALFPADELVLHGYHRIIPAAAEFDTLAIELQLKQHFFLQASSTPLLPSSSHEVGVYINQHWYQCVLANEKLTAEILEPILGIKDVRTDQRIGFLGGPNALHEIIQGIDSKQIAIAFTMYPSTVAQIMAFADVGGIMPPKSTWFHPKLLDGMLCYLF